MTDRLPSEVGQDGRVRIVGLRPGWLGAWWCEWRRLHWGNYRHRRIRVQGMSRLMLEYTYCGPTREDLLGAVMAGRRVDGVHAHTIVWRVFGVYHSVTWGTRG